MDLDETYLSQVVLSFEQEQFLILCKNVGKDQEYLTHQLLRIPQQVQWELQMLHTFEEINTSESRSEQTKSKRIVFNEKRETFMQTLSQYLNSIEVKFGFFLFEAIVNLHGEDHL